MSEHRATDQPADPPGSGELAEVFRAAEPADGYTEHADVPGTAHPVQRTNRVRRPG